MFDRSDDVVFAGVLSGTGSTRFAGPGMTTLTADSSGFAGDVSVEDGNLRIAAGGALGTSLLTVGTDGTLSGLGAIMGNVSVLGTLAPGAATLGTLTVDGDVAFDAGSTFRVRIASSGGNDAVAATTASLDGGVTVNAIDAGTSYLDGQTYTILTTSNGNGVTGTFDGATMLNNSAFLTPTLSYGADNVVLTLAVTADFTSVANTYNQRQAAGALNDLDQSGDSLVVFNELAMLDPGEARDAFDRSSGEIHAAGQHVIDQTFALFNRALRDRARSGIDGGTDVSGAALTGYAPTARPMPGVVAINDATAARLLPMPRAWVATLGGHGEIGADGNASGIGWGLGGLAGGYEGPVDVANGDAWFGFGLGYLGSRSTIDALLSTENTSGFGFGTYGAWTDGPWSVSGSLAYIATSIATSRTIEFGSVDRVAAAQYWAHSVGVSGEVAYGFDIAPNMTLSPLATLDAGWSGHNGFKETGAGSLDLSGAAESWNRFDVGLGVALAYVMPTEVGLLHLDGRVVWEHGFAGATPTQSMMFDGSPTRFSVRGPDAGHDRLHVGGGLSLDVAEDVSISARYDGRIRRTRSTTPPVSASASGSEMKLFLGVFAFASLMAGTWPSLAAGIPGGATALNETHGDWTLSCTAPEGVVRCTISQVQVQGENKQRVLAMELTRPPGDTGAAGTLVLPFGLRLSEGITLGLDQEAPFESLQFSTCLPAGCLVPVSFDPNLLSAIGGSTSLAIKAVANDSGEPVTLSVSMRGLSSALARLAQLTDP